MYVKFVKKQQLNNIILILIIFLWVHQELEKKSTPLSEIL